MRQCNLLLIIISAHKDTPFVRFYEFFVVVVVFAEQLIFVFFFFCVGWWWFRITTERSMELLSVVGLLWSMEWRWFGYGDSGSTTGHDCHLPGDIAELTL